MNTPLDIQHNPAASRFEVTLDGLLGEASYRLRGGVMEITHTGVPPALGGRGIAGRLIEAALAHARAEGLKVLPSCSYAAAYMQRHPETHDLLAR